MSFLVLLVASQILGLAGVIGARSSEGSRLQSMFYILFFAAYLLVGGCAMASVAMGNHGWLYCVVTLTIMSLGAVLDTARSPMQNSAHPF